MLDIQLLRNDLESVTARLATRGFKLDPEAFAALEQERKEVQTRTQELQAKRNNVSKQIGIAKSKGEDVAPIMAEVAGLGEQLKVAEERLLAIQAQMQGLLLNLPNLPHASVPVGKSEEDNAEVRKVGTP
ncbi:MAG TPA: serine--tRNA ligase, partial [Methylophilaceae bacterium]|nr:serine--tRNA ligase [Methylophilaceae bacterium]